MAVAIQTFATDPQPIRPKSFANCQYVRSVAGASKGFLTRTRLSNSCDVDDGYRRPVENSLQRELFCLVWFRSVNKFMVQIQHADYPQYNGKRNGVWFLRNRFTLLFRRLFTGVVRYFYNTTYMTSQVEFPSKYFSISIPARALHCPVFVV